MARILSIDYGKKRTGLAHTDPLQLIAGGLKTVETSRLQTELEQLLATGEYEEIIIGLPMQTNGQASENQARVRCFAGTIRKKHPEIPLTFYDERFTSVLAHRTMLDGGLGKKKRQDKALVDEISATIMLQEYLERKRSGR